MNRLVRNVIATGIACAGLMVTFSSSLLPPLMMQL